MPQAAWDGNFREENDAQVKWPPGQQSLENISWTEAPPEGTYTVYVELFRGPKAGMLREKMEQDGWSYGMGGSFISKQGTFFLKKYINQNLEVIPDTRNHPFFGRHSDSRFEKDNIY